MFRVCSSTIGIDGFLLFLMQAAFIPSTEGDNDTSNFACCHPWNTEDDQIYAASRDFDDMTDPFSMSCSSRPHSCDLDEDVSK